MLRNLKKLPPKKKRIEDAWLTVNRTCNMKCPWCYANNLEESLETDMDFEKAKKLVDILVKAGFKHITILGGEPTLYTNLFELIRYVSEKGIRVTLVTNGIKLSDQEYCEELKHSGVETISISIKGCSDREYAAFTNIHKAYTKVMNAIQNVNFFGIKLSVSFVLTNDIMKNFLDTIIECRKNGATHISLSFCYDFSNIEGRAGIYSIEQNILQVLDCFELMYEKIHETTKGDFRIKQSLPMCAWSDNIIQNMEARGQISYTCQVLKQSGLVFDSKLRVIPCNAMHKIVLGEYEVDFSSEDELEKFLNSEKIDLVYQCFKTLPAKECYRCEKKIKCRGGCISNWFNFSLEEFLATKNEYDKQKFR